MKGKKLAAKIMLGLLLATPYTFNQAYAEEGTLYGTETEINDNILLNIENPANRTFAIRAQAYKNENVFNVKLNSETINVKLVADETTGKTNTYFNGIEAGTFNNGNLKYDGPNLYLGNENTKDITINTNVSGTGNGTIGLWAYNETVGENYQTNDGPQIKVNGENLTITVHAEDAASYGICAQNSSTVTTGIPATININTTNTTINATSGLEDSGSGIVAMSEGIVNINSNLEVNADNAIVARGDAKVRINESGEKTTKLNGDINFNYDGSTSGTKVDAEVIVNLTGSESYWNGNSTVSWDYVGDNKPADDKLIVKDFKLTVADGAQWNPNKIDRTDSTYEDDKNKTHVTGGAYLALNNLTLNDGIVNLEKMENQELQIENLSGNGGTVNVASADNKLAITESNNVKSLTVAAKGAYAEELVKQDIVDSLTQLGGQVVDSFDGDKTAATSAVIAETGVVGTTIGQFDENGDLITDSVRELTNQTTAGIGELANVAFMAWRAENDEMHQRMGELRSSTGEAGIWARMKRGESESGDLGINNQYNTYQLGYDEKVGDSNWYLGGAISRTEGKSSFATGSGENQSTGFTVYGTYVGEDGHYVDLSAKYARLDNEFDVFGRDGIESKGDYRNNGYAFSAEYGKRIEAGNDFWIEPQVQLTYGHLSSANYTTSRGIKAAQDAMDSLVGRVGFAAGKDISAGNVYVKASYLYDFDGDTSVTMNDGFNTRTYEQDLGGGWFEFGIGTNINLSETSHLYFDVERAVGGDIDTPWQWNAGVRFDF